MSMSPGNYTGQVSEFDVDRNDRVCRASPAAIGRTDVSTFVVSTGTRECAFTERFDTGGSFVFRVQARMSMP
jgi:hypothetical protein